MKKFFYIVAFLFSFRSVASAQTADQVKSFIIQTFPQYMPEYVLQHVDTVAVTEHYAKKHKKTAYQYTDLKGVTYQGLIRIGDTLLVFNDQPFYSKGQGLFIAPPVKEPKNRAVRTQVQTNTPTILSGGDGYGTRVIY